MVSGKESTFLGWESTFLGIKTTLFGRNLNKQHFWRLGVLWVFLGSSLVSPWSLARGRLGRYKGRKS